MQKNGGQTTKHNYYICFVFEPDIRLLMLVQELTSENHLTKTETLGKGKGRRIKDGEWGEGEEEALRMGKWGEGGKNRLAELRIIHMTLIFRKTYVNFCFLCFCLSQIFKPTVLNYSKFSKVQYYILVPTNPWRNRLSGIEQNS